MGKAKKLKVSRSSTDKGLSLTDQVMSDETVKQSGRIKVRKRKDEDEEVSGNWGSLISSTLRLQSSGKLRGRWHCAPCVHMVTRRFAPKTFLPGGFTPRRFRFYFSPLVVSPPNTILPTGTRQFIDKTTHRHGFWRQFIDTIEDNSSTLFEDNSSTHYYLAIIPKLIKWRQCFSIKVIYYHVYDQNNEFRILIPYSNHHEIAYVNIEASDEPAYPRSLVRSFSVR